MYNIYIYIYIYIIYIYMFIYIWNRKTLAQNVKMNTIYVGKFRYTPMINSKNKFETLVWRLMKG